MPLVQGPEVADAVSEAHRGTRILFMSGYAQPAMEASALRGKDFQLLEKPFTEAVLLRKIREVLDVA